MSLADACLVRLAERYPGGVIFTLDTDFRIYRRHGNKVIAVLMPGGLSSASFVSCEVTSSGLAMGSQRSFREKFDESELCIYKGWNLKVNFPKYNN